MSAIATNQVFSAVHTVGALLPADWLVRVADGKEVDGSKPGDYRVVGKRSVRDEAERHWDYLRSLWRELREQLPPAPEAATPADPTGIAISGFLLPLFAELGFGELTTVGAAGIPSDDGAKTFPVSHRWTGVPIHLARWQTSLDRRVTGAVPPQSLVQECLNRTEKHLWGVLSNGRQLRLLRDSSALATSSYVEFDLEAIFDGELFSEFVLLYRLLHVTRFAVAENEPPTKCWLERWRTEAIKSGTRALKVLRNGVRDAITELGTGFLKHPDNNRLREHMDPPTLHAALLRLVYRLLFLFVVEDRDVLHPRDTPTQARDRYATYFSTAKLREHARRRRGTAHHDRYQALQLVLRALADENGRPELGLPGLGGIFDHTAEDSIVDGLALSNEHLFTAVRHLARVRDAGRWRPIDYRHLDAEELGSIYESLLELIPKHSAVDRRFELQELPGNARKDTGSYYTSSALIERVLNSSLDPVIDEAVKRGEQQATTADPTESIVDELLKVTVCDPACGSGHFLVAAARRIAKRVAAVREHNPEPPVDAVRHALHEVIARCIYGVDLNSMAVDLAKVSLWLEAMEPGTPLSFLDAHLKHGNALLGATPALLHAGIPDAAFKPVEGDEPKTATDLGKRNAEERKGQGSLFDLPVGPKVTNMAFAAELRRITDAPVRTLADVRNQAATYRDWENSAEYAQARHIADAWCAAVVWRKTKDAPPAITQDVFTQLRDPKASATTQATHQEIVHLRDQYTFFHWHLVFPDIFPVPDDNTGVDPTTGWAGGFSCVLANPPWDKVDFEDKKYFPKVEASIAEMSGLARRDRIAEWVIENPDEGAKYHAERRKVKSSFLFYGSSGAFPLTGKGLSIKGVNSLNLDHLFVERFTAIAAPTGRIGCIIPTSIATGAGAQYLFGDLTQRGAITHLYDFENRKEIFEGVDSRQKFCLLSLVGRELREPEAEFAFFLLDDADLDDPDRVFALSPEEIELINPNTGNLPIFRTRRDADLTTAIHERIPVLWNEKQRNGNPWHIRFNRLFDLTDDSDLFRKREQLERDGWKLDGNIFTRNNERMLPLYEAKMVHHFDHRWNSFYGTGKDDRSRLTPHDKSDPAKTPNPRYWIAEAGYIHTERNGKDADLPGVDMRLQEIRWDHDWLSGWRDVCRSTDERTAIPAFLPRTAAGHTLPLMLPHVRPALTGTLVAAQSSLVFDYVSRQKIGGIHMALMTWKQLPVPAPQAMESHTSFITPRVLELVYTAYDMAGLAQDLDDDEPPFRWDEGRRAQIRAELDAYFFHLYGVERPDVDYVLETFQSDSGGGLKHNEIAKYGEYRTRRLVLAEYERMAEAGVSLEKPLTDGENYTSTLDPPPGHGARHPAKEE